MEKEILEEWRKGRTKVRVFLMNGFQLQGVIDSFDIGVVVIAAEGKTRMIYKHAISTIEV